MFPAENRLDIIFHCPNDTFEIRVERKKHVSIRRYINVYIMRKNTQNSNSNLYFVSCGNLTEFLSLTDSVVSKVVPERQGSLHFVVAAWRGLLLIRSAADLLHKGTFNLGALYCSGGESTGGRDLGRNGF
jgi:hypothetical protein